MKSKCPMSKKKYYLVLYDIQETDLKYSEKKILVSRQNMLRCKLYPS